MVGEDDTSMGDLTSRTTKDFGSPSASAPSHEWERRIAKLHRTGGSLSVVIPKAWIEDLGIRDEVELVRSDVGVLITAPYLQPSIEDEPEFALFLNHLLRDALTHPETLGDVGELLEGTKDLFDGVETD